MKHMVVSSLQVSLFSLFGSTIHAQQNTRLNRDTAGTPPEWPGVKMTARTFIDAAGPKTSGACEA